MKEYIYLKDKKWKHPLHGMASDDDNGTSSIFTAPRIDHQVWEAKEFMSDRMRSNARTSSIRTSDEGK